MSVSAETTDVIKPSSIVNVTLKQYPETTGVFNQYGIDSCCGGSTSITEAATRDGADPQALLDALNLAIAGNAA